MTQHLYIQENRLHYRILKEPVNCAVLLFCFKSCYFIRKGKIIEQNLPRYSVTMMTFTSEWVTFGYDVIAVTVSSLNTAQSASLVNVPHAASLFL